jgi:hypothetical protein
MKIDKPSHIYTRSPSLASSIKTINIKQSNIEKELMVNLLSTKNVFNKVRRYNSIPYLKSEPEYLP